MNLTISDFPIKEEDKEINGIYVHKKLDVKEKIFRKIHHSQRIEISKQKSARTS